MAFYEGIERLEKTVEDIKNMVNMQLTAMDVIENPMSAAMAKIGFDLLESYVKIEKNNQEWHEKFNEKLIRVEADVKEIEQLRRELERIKKES